MGRKAPPPVPDGGTESSDSEHPVLCHYYDADGLCGNEAQDLVRGKTGSPRGAQAKRLLSARIPVCQSHGEYLTDESGIRYEFIGRFLGGEELRERMVLPDDWPRHCSLDTDSDHEPVPDGGTENSGSERFNCPHCEAASIYSERQLQNHIQFFHRDKILTDGGTESSVREREQVWEVGVRITDDHDRWEHYHPAYPDAKTEEEAAEAAREMARKPGIHAIAGFRDPLEVYMVAGPFERSLHTGNEQQEARDDD